MKVTVIPVVISALGSVTKELVQRLEYLEIRGQVETIQTTALLRSDRIQRRVLETWGDLLSLKLQWETPAQVDELEIWRRIETIQTIALLNQVEYYEDCLAVT